MPLTLAGTGERHTIKKIVGKNEIKKQLEALGFATGDTITIVTAFSGNLIARVKESQIAISREMAHKIIV